MFWLPNKSNIESRPGKKAMTATTIQTCLKYGLDAVKPVKPFFFTRHLD